MASLRLRTLRFLRWNRGRNSYGFHYPVAMVRGHDAGMPDLLTVAKEGLYCPAGGFYIDPWKKVDRAVITHGHSDHARGGHGSYLCAEPGLGILKTRLGKNLPVTGQPYGKVADINGVKVSFYPAGHVLGSAQVRVEHMGEVWVASGDYKLDDDGISGAFEPVKCHTFITESTFGLPIYRWPSQDAVAGEINEWWQANQKVGISSVIYTYSLGKAQRIQHAVDSSIGPIFAYHTIATMNAAYAAEGVQLPAVSETEVDGPGLIIAPPSADDSEWLRRFGECRTAFASGWMRVRKRRWGDYDKGFVMSDHVDWPGMLSAIEQSEAERILVTHGYSAQAVRYLREDGWDADGLETHFAEED